ncbi:hypothetical protein B0H13DRAFT_1908199 [Mycena leptocephala]|nr:hypothetical protein B0H13DRAFT_1908199 [Mycena leptocephala]
MHRVRGLPILSTTTSSLLHMTALEVVYDDEHKTFDENHEKILICVAIDYHRAYLALLTAGKLGGLIVKVDTLGTTEILAGRLHHEPASGTNEPAQRRDPPPHFAARGIPSVSGLAPPSRQGFAFGSRIPPNPTTRSAFLPPGRNFQHPPKFPCLLKVLLTSFDRRPTSTRTSPTPSGSRPRILATPVTARRSSVHYATDPQVLSPIPERATLNSDLRNLMDTSADSHDNSLGAETSHAAPEERDTTPTSPARELRDAFYKDDEGSLEDEDESLALNIAMMSGRLSLRITT